MQLETRVNYSQEILYVLNKLWVDGGRDELQPVSLNKFLDEFKPANMKGTPEKIKKHSGIFWSAMFYKLAQKV